MFNFSKKKQHHQSNKWIFGTMLVGAIAGLVAAFTLTVEKFHLIEDPNATLTCTFNLVLNCATVMQTWQASVFGFPNSLIGLMGYPVVITVAVVGLAGAKLPRWFWITATVCYGLGALFAYWLFFTSVYVIEVLCPWCLVVTFVTTIIFATITHFVLRDNILKLNKKNNERVQAFLAKDAGKLIVASWIVLLIALVFIKFGDSLFA